MALLPDVASDASTLVERPHEHLSASARRRQGRLRPGHQQRCRAWILAPSMMGKVPIAQLRQWGSGEAILVSSGAIAQACSAWLDPSAPSRSTNCRRLVAVGQMGLAQVHESAFTHGLHTAQVLLTHDDLADRKRYLNARSTPPPSWPLEWCPSSTNDTVVT